MFVSAELKTTLNEILLNASILSICFSNSTKLPSNELGIVKSVTFWYSNSSKLVLSPANFVLKYKSFV